MDAFGLHRSIERSLLGIYFIFAGLTVQERRRRSFVFTCRETLDGYQATLMLMRSKKVVSEASPAMSFDRH